MSSIATVNQVHALARSDGHALLWAAEAIVKGLLETQVEVRVVAGSSRGALARVFQTAMQPEVAALLRQHAIQFRNAPDASRALTLARFAAQSNQAAFALLANDELDSVISMVSQACREPLDRGGALCLIFEDDPIGCAALCATTMAYRLNMPAIEPADVGQLRDAMEHAAFLSRAGRCPVGVIVHRSIIDSADTLEMRPNRVLSAVEAKLAHGLGPRFRRRVRLADAKCPPGRCAWPDDLS
jgi:TPP-dependent indolepyruvate ferredoxin oxidoreductase alpha subunit